MPWHEILASNPVSWLMEQSPDVRFLTAKVDPSAVKSREQFEEDKNWTYQKGLIGQILENMQPDGFWEKQGGGYSPKYYSAVWSLLSLAQMGAHIDEDARVRKAAAYYLDHAWVDPGFITYNGKQGSSFECLQGNMCASLLDMGVEDERMDGAFEWMARGILGEGIAPYNSEEWPRYQKYNIGPDFVCRANALEPCAWGAVKMLWAFGKQPSTKRTPLIQKAIEKTVAFLLDTPPEKAEYPHPRHEKPSQHWWKFGFPVFYISDLLQLLDGFVSLGYGTDPRLKPVWEIVRNKMDEDGRFLLEHHYHGKTWVKMGRKNSPNPWVTLRVWKIVQKMNSSNHN